MWHYLCHKKFSQSLQCILRHFGGSRDYNCDQNICSAFVPLQEPYSLKEYGRDNGLGEWIGWGTWYAKICPTFDGWGTYIDSTTCSIPPFSYLYPKNSISPRGGSALVCSVLKNPDTPDQYLEYSLHGILISEPIKNSDKNYIGEFLSFKIWRIKVASK